MGDLVLDVKAIREHARQHIEQGAVTSGNKTDRKRVVQVLNEALATELLCALRYKRHYYTARGIHAETVKSEFQQHAAEELQHADWIADRINQLDAEPNFSPDGMAQRSHAEYDESLDLEAMIRADLIAERIAIETYSAIIRWLGNDDPTTRKIIEDILKMEEEHANDMADLLARVAAH
jgi:bacterioferritin